MKNLYLKTFFLFSFLCCICIVGHAQYILMQNSSTPVEVGDADGPSYFYDSGGIPTFPGPNNDPQGRFERNIRDTLVLKTSIADARLYVIFEEFGLGVNDTLFLFDGPNTNSPLMGVFNSVYTPGERTASGEYLTAVFHSDSVDDPGDLGIGWEALAYSFTNNPINYILDPDNSGLDHFTCQGKLVDHGGINGKIGNNQGGWCNIISPVGTHVVATKVSFQVGGIMKIYDGLYMDPNKRLIGQFCTSTSEPPLKLISSNNVLCFEYVPGSGDNNKNGWEFDLSCVDEIFEVPTGSACPQITISSPDSMGNYVDMSVINSDCHNPVYVLKANITATGPYTYDYTVTQIPYDPPFEFTAGNPIPSGVDDQWLQSVHLDFNFSFFGTNYNNVYPSCNGLFSFTPNTGHCEWDTRNCPTSTSTPPYSGQKPYIYPNSVYGVMEDGDPSYFLPGGAIRYGKLGTSPCRTFVFNYDRVGQFSCHNTSDPNTYNSYQMVIYEGTNIIDVYIKHKGTCESWNDGNGVVGIQNNTSSQIIIAPGRDFNPNWTANNEAWRFTPITTMDPNGTLDWYINDINTESIGQGKKLVVSPSQTTNYIVKYTYTNASNQTFTVMDTIRIVVDIPPVNALDANAGDNPITYCPLDDVDVTCEVEGSTGVVPMSYRWSSGDTTQTCTVNPSQTTTYEVTVTFNNGCKSTDAVNIKITDLEFPEITGKDHICEGQSTTLTATLEGSPVHKYTWNVGREGETITVNPLDTTDYVVTALLDGDCKTTDTFRVYVMPNPRAAFTVTPTDVFVESGEGRVYCTNMTTPEGISNTWNFGDLHSDLIENIQTDIDDPQHNYTHPGNYSINLTVVDENECRDSVAHQVTVTVPFFFYVPNSFTPDGDGNNDIFAPKGEGVEAETYEMLIYDRNGSLQFKSGNIETGWDGTTANGKPAMAGVYVYQIRFKTMNGEEKLYSGSITLVK